MVFTANSSGKNRKQFLCNSKQTKNKVIVIAGPTACGKSELALNLAERFDCRIINADSMQVYRDVPTLTARPSLEDETKADHRLYGFLEPNENCSVFKWVHLAALEIQNCWKDNKIPVVVGGTGFYLQTLIKGISPVPQTNAVVRSKLRQEFQEQGYDLFLQNLQKKDPSFSFTDPQRVLRAAEVLEQTGKSITYWQSLPFQKEIEADFFKVFIDLPRDDLYNRCDERFKAMMQKNVIEEVRSLLAKNPPADSPVLKAVGVFEIQSFLKREITLQQAVEQACRMTRNYAKRQITWFKHRFDVDCFLNDVKSADILTKALHFLE